MGNYLRKTKRAKEEKVKAPRCCGRHMFMNKYGLWQCRKCGRQKFDIGSAPQPTELVNDNDNAVTNAESPIVDVTDSTTEIN